MSVGSEASSTDWRQRFRAIWHVDFEFREDPNHLPIPVCMYAREEHSGATISLWRDELLRLTRAPFDTGPDSVMVAFASNAELQCFLVLSWPFPTNVLDPYVENILAINGNTAIWPPKDLRDGHEKHKKRKGRPGLLDALDIHGLPGTGRSKEEKDRIRRMILDNEEYTEVQRQEIQHYNKDDVYDTGDLLGALAPTIDIDRALFFGRYMAAVTRMERVGLPVDRDYLDELVTKWDAIRLHYIQRDDEFHLYDGVNFVEKRLWDLVAAKGWDWPRTPTGRYELKLRTIGKQATRYPELKSLARLRDQIAELRINNLANTIGPDSFSRCPLLPFWTVTGRNQPSAKDKMFLLNLPTWLHGALKPPPGMGLAELDLEAEEIAIVAGLSGDKRMIADYESGDPHWQFAIRAGLAPSGASPDDFPGLRDLCKPVTHGMNYGMTPYGIAAKTKKSMEWAREIHARHRHIYPVFHQWRGDVVAQARFDEVITSPFGWRQIVTADTRTRTLMNFMAQAGGGDVMRLVSIVATECGIIIAAPVHDAFWILAPLDKLDATIARMTEIMIEAGKLVTGGLPIRVKVGAVVRWPQCLGDVRAPNARGQAMWCEVRDLVRNGGLKVSHA
jgi:DNA polymerase family A